MTDVLELLGNVSPHLKVGWIIWSAAGLALLSWSLVARLVPVRVERPVAAVPTVRRIS